MTACSPRRGSVASLSTVMIGSPAACDSVSTPQWPWSVYSQKHRSVITSTSGAAAFASRTARAMMPSDDNASLPAASLDSGRPNRITAGMPAAAMVRIIAGRSASGSCDWPGIDPIGVASPSGLTNSGRMKSCGVSVVSRTSARSAGCCRSRRSRTEGTIASPWIRTVRDRLGQDAERAVFHAPDSRTTDRASWSMRSAMSASPTWSPWKCSAVA